MMTDREVEVISSLVTYLGFHCDICDMLELWEQLGGIYSPCEMGVADYLAYTYGADEVVKLISSKLIERLLGGEDSDERKEAADLLVYTYGVEELVKMLSPELIPKLVSDDPDERGESSTIMDLIRLAGDK